MDIYSPRSTIKLVLSVFSFFFAVVFSIMAFAVDFNRTTFSAIVVVALAFFGVALWLFFSYFNRYVLLHVDEEGVFTMYQFYLPWKYIHSFYIKDDAFIEIKIVDNEKYLAEMDPDIYSAYYDEIELAHIHGHELFYFPVAAMALEPEQVLRFLNRGMEKYKK